MMVSFFYPENGERFPGSPEFNYTNQAVWFFEWKRPLWEKIETHSEQDKAAFMNPIDGTIVVVRDVVEAE